MSKKVIFDIDEHTIQIIGFNLIPEMYCNDLSREFGIALRAACEINPSIATAVQAAAIDYNASRGITEKKILKKFFPKGYKPSEWK